MSSVTAAAVLARLCAAGVQARGIKADSRKLEAGDIFVAWPGARHDGRRHLAEAVERGAAAVLWESSDGFEPEPLAVPGLGVAGLRALAGFLAAEIHQHPSAQLWLAGVTGSNGKTSVSQMLAAALQDHGSCCGIIGTLGDGFPGQLEPTPNTTPDAIELQGRLADMKRAGARAVAMEVSSIGIDQGRVNGLQFDVLLFTNLSRDHLDYHRSMAAYGAVKAELFAQQPAATAVINIDDDFGLQLASGLARQQRTLLAYGMRQERFEAVAEAPRLYADDVEATPTGQRFQLHWQGRQRAVEVALVGRFNISNVLAVAAALLVFGVDFDRLPALLQQLQAPPGRMQSIGGNDEPLVVIDYAHSPDALAAVLQALRSTASSRQGILSCVFGCGGERDTGKRPLMGEVAARFADRMWITSDNPRFESASAIIAAIAAGAGDKARSIEERGAAIVAAINEAAAADVVLIAGKGHESEQEIDGRRLPFSDLEQAQLALQGWRQQRESASC